MKPQPETLPRVRRFFSEHPWAILPAAFDAVLEVVERRAAGIRLSDEEIAARIEAARRPPRSAAAPGTIAVLPLHGVISHRIGMLDDISGGTSVEAWARDFQAAIDDPNVTAVLIDVNSPGGSVFGIEELADRIHAARGTKPIVAIANAQAASAAYWIATQADELVVIPSGEVGSVGVIAVHDDLSVALEKYGAKRTYVTAGRFKAEGNPTEPLGDEARAHLQARVDDYYDAFVRAVARGRGTSLKNVRENFGEGRMLGAAQAVARGMADREGTFEDAVARLASRQVKAGARAELEAPPVAADDVGVAPQTAAEPAGESLAEGASEDRERLRLQLERARLARRA
jgi:signal peptide peptidase SppA